MWQLRETAGGKLEGVMLLIGAEKVPFSLEGRESDLLYKPADGFAADRMRCGFAPQLGFSEILLSSSEQWRRVNGSYEPKWPIYILYLVTIQEVA